MVDISGFNAADVDMTSEFDTLPVGRYHAEIINSEERDIGKTGEKGRKITLTWKVVAGPCEGRLAWQDILHGYNVEGEKGDKTRNNAAKDLSAVCNACGKPAPASTEELHHIPCQINVVVKKDDTGQYGDSTQIAGFGKGVTAINSGSGAGSASRPAPAAQRQAPASSAPSGGGWNRRSA